MLMLFIQSNKEWYTNVGVFKSYPFSARSEKLNLIIGSCLFFSFSAKAVHCSPLSKNQIYRWLIIDPDLIIRVAHSFITKAIFSWDLQLTRMDFPDLQNEDSLSIIIGSL